MRFPDLFIIGAPKCGTTAIYRYLQTHPDIFMPRKKEPHYFSFDIPGRRDFVDEQDYLALFESGRQAPVVGEGSASYLFSEVAIQEIMKRSPAAKMIAMIRNPVDAAHSFHSERLYNLSEDVADFEKAWSLQEKRACRKYISKYCRGAELLQYRSVFSYSHQIKRFFHIVPENQRLVFIFEEFCRNPRQVYMAILEFLGLPDDGRREFPAFHANKVLRSRRLAEWHHSQLIGPRNWFHKLEGMANVFGLPPSKVITKLNAKRKPRTPLAPHLRRQLASEFAPDVRELERLLGHRLDCWSDFCRDQTTPLEVSRHRKVEHSSMIVS